MPVLCIVIGVPAVMIVGVLAALRSYAADAKFVHGSAKELLIEDGRCVGVRTSDGKTHRAAHVLVTTGGTSYPATGSGATPLCRPSPACAAWSARIRPAAR